MVAYGPAATWLRSNIRNPSSAGLGEEIDILRYLKSQFSHRIPQTLAQYLFIVLA